MLAVQTRGAGPVIKVFRITGGVTTTQIGNDITPASGIQSGTENNYYDTNFAVQYGNDLFLIYGTDIHKYNSGTGNWDAQGLALPMQTTDGYRRHSGLYHVSISNAPYLLAVFTDAATSDSRYLTYDGTSWVTSGVVVTSSAIFFHGRAIVYRNSLWFPTTGDEIYQVDPAAGTFTRYDGGNNDCNARVLCAFNNELYLISSPNNGADDKWKLYIFSGGTFNAVQDLGTSVASGTPDLGTSENFGGTLLFTDGTDLFAVCACRDDTSGLYGNMFLRLVQSGGTFVETDLSDPVLPAALRFGGGATLSTGRWLSIIDNDTNPVSPVVHLYRQSEAVEANTHYLYNGIAAELTSEGSGLAYQIVMPFNTIGGGDRIWTSGELSIQITDMTSVIGGERISFKAYGDSGSSNKTVIFYYNANEERASTVATLQRAATGGSAVRSGNTVINVDADDGVTTYTVERNISSDGLASGDREVLMPTILA